MLAGLDTTGWLQSSVVSGGGGGEVEGGGEGGGGQELVEKADTQQLN